MVTAGNMQRIRELREQRAATGGILDPAEELAMYGVTAENADQQVTFVSELHCGDRDVSAALHDKELSVAVMLCMRGFRDTPCHTVLDEFVSIVSTLLDRKLRPIERKRLNNVWMLVGIMGDDTSAVGGIKSGDRHTGSMNVLDLLAIKDTEARAVTRYLFSTSRATTTSLNPHLTKHMLEPLSRMFPPSPPATIKRLLGAGMGNAAELGAIAKLHGTQELYLQFIMSATLPRYVWQQSDSDTSTSNVLQLPHVLRDTVRIIHGDLEALIPMGRLLVGQAMGGGGKGSSTGGDKIGSIVRALSELIRGHVDSTLLRELWLSGPATAVKRALHMAGIDASGLLGDKAASETLHGLYRTARKHASKFANIAQAFSTLWQARHGDSKQLMKAVATLIQQLLPDAKALVRANPGLEVIADVLDLFGDVLTMLASSDLSRLYRNQRRTATPAAGLSAASHPGMADGAGDGSGAEADSAVVAMDEPATAQTHSSTSIPLKLARLLCRNGGIDLSPEVLAELLAAAFALSKGTPRQLLHFLDRLQISGLVTGTAGSVVTIMVGALRPSMSILSGRKLGKSKQIDCCELRCTTNRSDRSSWCVKAMQGGEGAIEQLMELMGLESLKFLIKPVMLLIQG